MLYVDKADRGTRWVAYVRRKFEDGLWLWALGPYPRGSWPQPSDHHAYCVLDDCPEWRRTQHKGTSHVALPISRHVRCARCPRSLRRLRSNSS